jgi:hypothetical protein
MHIEGWDEKHFRNRIFWHPLKCSWEIIKNDLRELAINLLKTKFQ